MHHNSQIRVCFQTPFLILSYMVANYFSQCIMSCAEDTLHISRNLAILDLTPPIICNISIAVGMRVSGANLITPALMLAVSLPVLNSTRTTMKVMMGSEPARVVRYEALICSVNVDHPLDICFSVLHLHLARKRHSVWSSGLAKVAVYLNTLAKLLLVGYVSTDVWAVPAGIVPLCACTNGN